MGDASTLPCREGVFREVCLCCVNEVIVLIFRWALWGDTGGEEIVCPSYASHTQNTLFISILLCYLFIYFALNLIECFY